MQHRVLVMCVYVVFVLFFCDAQVTRGMLLRSHPSSLEFSSKVTCISFIWLSAFCMSMARLGWTLLSRTFPVIQLHRCWGNSFSLSCSQVRIWHKLLFSEDHKELTGLTRVVLSLVVCSPACTQWQFHTWTRLPCFFVVSTSSWACLRMIRLGYMQQLHSLCCWMTAPAEI